MRRSEKNYSLVAKLLGEVMVKIEKRKDLVENAKSAEEAKRIENFIIMNKANVKAIIEAVAKNMQEVFMLAYQLKLRDAKENTKYCRQILLSDEYTNSIPDIVQKIIIANKSNADGEISVNPESKFML